MQSLGVYRGGVIMNAVFKVVYNEALQVFQAVNEMTRSRGKRASSNCGEQLIDFSVNKFRVHFSGVAAALLATGFMTASPSSALASVFNVDGSASVAGKNTYDQMKSEDEQAHLVFKAGDVLIINGTGESTLKASLESQDGNGTFIFENGLLRVSDNASGECQVSFRRFCS